MDNMNTYEVELPSGKLEVVIGPPGCSHLDQIQDVSPSAEGCEECLQTGDQWFHLRICVVCGHVGCCDTSKNKHATKHHHQTQHPIIQSFQPGEDWMYCYPDDAVIEPLHQ